jgi:hypothetical protein
MNDFFKDRDPRDVYSDLIERYLSTDETYKNLLEQGDEKVLAEAQVQLNLAYRNLVDALSVVRIPRIMVVHNRTGYTTFYDSVQETDWLLICKPILDLDSEKKET